MRVLSAVELLDVWETRITQTPTERALALLALACPEISWDALAALTVGQRDAGLLKLREALWGSRMTAAVDCPGCGEKLELALDTREMLSNSPENPADEIPLTFDDYKVIFRLPTSRDLLAAVAEGSSASGLLQRCVLSVRKGDEQVAPERLPTEVAIEVTKCMARTDPLADIQLDLICPACQHRWQAIFDTVSFVWTELEVWAWRMLSDVHTLASAYGWGEQDILSLSPARRQFYLEMVGA